MKKIALFGGSFDPVHKGHIEVAKMAMKQCGCHEVWFIPAHHTPLKSQLSVDFQGRCKMLKLAIKPYHKFKICTIEQELPSPSYTINTIKALQKIYPEVQFIWIIGDDQARQLNQWKEIDVLVKLISFVVVSRSNVPLECEYPHTFLENFTHPASSTLIKQGAFKYLDKAVLRYVLKHHLYMDEVLRYHCSEKRALHSHSVARLAKELASLWGVDEQSAYLAGLLHDVCKEMNKEESLAIMNAFYPEYMGNSNKIWHQYIAMYFLKHILFIHDSKIINAVGNHVMGKNTGKMARIIYLSDKIEPSRGYDSSVEIAMSKRDLKTACEYVETKQKAFILKKEDKHV